MQKAEDVNLCEYELKRIENINRNRDFLEKLGILHTQCATVFHVKTTDVHGTVFIL